MQIPLTTALRGAGITEPSASCEGILITPDPFNEENDIRLHQLSGLGGGLEHRAFGLWDDPGTGKSLISYMYAAYKIATGKKVLAVMPPSLALQYSENFLRQVDGLDCNVALINQPPSEREALFKYYRNTSWPDLLVIGYQMFLKCRPRLPDYEVYIADEAHALKNASSKTHKVFAEMSDEKDTLLMTGSPMPTTPEDAYGLIKIKDPYAYPSKRSFDRQHLIKQRINNFWMTVGFKNLDRLSDNLYRAARRVTKEEVLDLKKPNVIPVDLKLSKRHMSKYKQLVEERVLVNDDALISAVEAATLRRITSISCSFPQEYFGLNERSEMLNVLDDLMGTVNLAKTKLIIFANYIETVEGLAEYLKGFNPAVVYSKTNTDKEKAKFTSDDTCRVAVINPQAGGAGLDGMQYVAHNVIAWEPFTSPGQLDQCSSRLIRSGQEHVVNVYLMRVRGTSYMKAINSTLLGRTQDYKQTMLKPGDLLNELLGAV